MLIVTIPAWLKVQSAPAGRPVVQLPGLEVVESVKFTTPVKPPTGVTVIVVATCCPAEALTLAGLADRLKGAATLTITAEDVEGALIPLYTPTTEFVPAGSVVVVKVAVPPDTAPEPKAVVEPLL